MECKSPCIKIEGWKCIRDIFISLSSHRTKIEQNSQELDHPANLPISHTRELSLRLSNILQSIKLKAKHLISRKTFTEPQYELNKKIALAIVELPKALGIQKCMEKLQMNKVNCSDPPSWHQVKSLFCQLICE